MAVRFSDRTTLLVAAAGFASEWESRASPPKAAKTGLDARLGPKTWERPLDGFNAPRAAPGWLPRTPAGARVPMLSRCQSCQIPEIRNVLRIYMGRRARRRVFYGSSGPLAPASFARH